MLPFYWVGATVSAKENKATPEHLDFFETKVRPLLSKHCYECHSKQAKKPKGGLLLDTRASVLKGGDSGKAAIPGKPAESLIIKAIRYEDDEMPPTGKLPAKEIAILEKWIQLGVPWPQDKETTTNQQKDPNKYNWELLRKNHWAYRPVQKPKPPKVNHPNGSINEVDQFILVRLKQAKLKPSPPADLRILLRRIYYDLIGLPPTAKETDAFIKAAKSNRLQAVKKVVDQLLASSHYGERWGRHWLDVARYADDLPHAWRYRDWVINSLNQDMPYDQFVKLQIAGDLIAGKQGAVATGFFALGPTYKSDGGDPDSVAQTKSETLDDRMDTFSRGLMALTVSCARCHDHKFDPIPTQDYYSLAGIFNNTRNTNQKSGMHALNDSGKVDMKIALRGNLRKPGPVAPRRFLRILSGADPPKFTKGSGRLELAQAVADPKNPLTARVIVNRIWQHHFGEGLVRTPSNFGSLGEKPTHPLLLDWLTAKFIEDGWSLKKLHRRIMASAAYQMSSQMDETSYKVDGDNRLLWRMSPRRLGAESWRDTLLSVTGELDRKIGGAPVANVQSNRRTLYFKVSRNGDKFPTDEFLRLFDFPLMRATVAKRPTSIVPQQFLFLMNSRFMLSRAQKLAARLEKEDKTDEARIDRAYRLLHGRLPSEKEKQLGLEFLKQVSKEKNNKLKPWQQYAQVLLSSNELMYVR